MLALQGRGQNWLERSIGAPKKDPRIPSTTSSPEREPFLLSTTKRSPVRHSTANRETDVGAQGL